MLILLYVVMLVNPFLPYLRSVKTGAQGDLGELRKREEACGVRYEV
jgi:hypothetical protein